MASGRQTALAIGAGYILGRLRQRKLAMMLGAAALAGGSGGPVSQVVRRGAKVAGSSLGSPETLGKLSPGAGEIAGMIRGDLAQAAKAAAAAAVSSRIDSLSDKLHERAETLRNPVTAAASSDESSQADGDEHEGGDAVPGESSAANRPGRDGATAERRRAPNAERRSTSTGERGPAEGRRAAAEAGSAAGSSRARRPAREAAGSAPPVRRAARRTSEGR